MPHHIISKEEPNSVSQLYTVLQRAVDIDANLTSNCTATCHDPLIKLLLGKGARRQGGGFDFLHAMWTIPTRALKGGISRASNQAKSTV